MASTEAVGAPHHDPLLGLDVARLEAEMERYHLWLDERTEEAYAIAEAARASASILETTWKFLALPTWPAEPRSCSSSTLTATRWPTTSVRCWRNTTVKRRPF